MSHVTLDEISQQTDAMDTGNFKLFFGAIPGSQDTQPLTILCKTATIPGVTVEPMEVILHQKTLRFRGRKTFSGTFAVGFQETVSYEIQRRLRVWNEYCVGTNTGQAKGYKRDYSVTPLLQVLDVTGAVADELKLFGVWPTEVPEISLEGESTAPMLVQATFAFDYFTSKWHDFE